MTTARLKKIILGAVIFLLGCIVLLIFKVFFNPSPFAFKIGEITLVIIVFIFLIWAFHRSVGFYFIVVGRFSNLLVIVVNGGMPILAYYQSGIYKPIADDTVLPFLADIFKLKISNGRFLYYSVGDALVVIGLLLVVLQIIIYIFKKYQISKNKDIVF